MKGFIEFIRAKGIPDVVEGTEQRIQTPELAQVATINKLQPFLTQNLDRGSSWQSQYNGFHDLLAEIGELLRDFNYAIVKTLRPIPHLPSDIDVLIDPADLTDAVKRLVKEDFKLLDKSPYGITLYNHKRGFNVDLSEELTVAGITYIDRNLVLNETINTRINGVEIKIPKPHMDLLVIIDHSIFKEWIYTLRDFYTTILWLGHLHQTLDLAYRESDGVAAEIFLTTTYLISEEAIGEDHFITEQLAEKLQRIPKGDVPNLPCRYRYIDLVRAYISKASYFSKKRRLEGLIRYGLTAKTARLFSRYVTRKSY